MPPNAKSAAGKASLMANSRLSPSGFPTGKKNQTAATKKAPMTANVLFFVITSFSFQFQSFVAKLQKIAYNAKGRGQFFETLLPICREKFVSFVRKMYFCAEKVFVSEFETYVANSET
jgi:hypothetical protein